MSSVVRIAYNLMKKRLSESTNSPDDLYKNYLYTHRAGVVDAYKSILPILDEKGIAPDTLEKIESLIIYHDNSKYSAEEFGAYRNYFYDKEKYPRSTEEFNRAWLHHQNHNPHHWQYWVLINDVDEPQLQPMDIPFPYIIEMLCDWQSAGNHYGNTAYEWYERQKDKMILTDKTRAIIEEYIVYFR